MFHDVVWSFYYDPVGEAEITRLDAVFVAAPHVSSCPQNTSDNVISHQLLVYGGKMMKLQTKHSHRSAKQLFIAGSDSKILALLVEENDWRYLHRF